MPPRLTGFVLQCSPLFCTQNGSIDEPGKFLMINDSKPGSGQTASEQEPPKIEFPCKDYPVKVMGDAGDEFRAFAIDVMERHAPGLDQARITVKGSRNGRFQSITFMITATSVEQLQALHTELTASPMTKMVL